MSLRSDIIQVPCNFPDHIWRAVNRGCFQQGHTAARNAAAELANAADSHIEDLESTVVSLTAALIAAKQYVVQTDDFGRCYSDDVLAVINKALGVAQ